MSADGTHEFVVKRLASWPPSKVTYGSGDWPWDTTIGRSASYLVCHVIWAEASPVAAMVV